MPRLQVHQQPHTVRVGALPQSHPGLCGTPVGPGRDTHGTPVPKQGRLWVARNNLHEDSGKRQQDTDKSQDRHAFSETRCWQETYMVAEPVRETGDQRKVEHVVNRIEVETSQILKKISQRNGTNHPGEDQPRDRVHQDSAE